MVAKPINWANSVRSRLSCPDSSLTMEFCTPSLTPALSNRQLCRVQSIITVSVNHCTALCYQESTVFTQEMVVKEGWEERADLFTAGGFGDIRDRVAFNIANELSCVLTSFF